ncbi:phosphatase PAP2 family protein [Flocculibacter collagenilyticus]|uniref:phosphatase PAP2 family protein n=1 Tax=Flocculibacter collagenilyticus TaxID=2744479 RepID=UPI001F32BADA|nr:phosphatase PAP2 family protein [Flocculibacter collagenilyticus]
MNMISDLYRFDLNVTRKCYKLRLYPSLMRFTCAISRSGDGYLQVVIPLLCWLIWPADAYLYMLTVGFAFVFERCLYVALKNTLKRRRPADVIPYFNSIICASDHFSFPSGHTMAAFLFAGISSYFFPHASIFLYLWAGGVGVSRVVLGVHFITDIIAGAILGSVIALSALMLI